MIYDEVLIYPVTAGDYHKFEWKSSQEVQSVGLYNMTGMLLHKYEINEGTNHLNIDVGSLPEGMYILQLNDREKTRVRKFPRSEEHTSELQSRGHLVCRLLLEKKN